MNSSLPLQTRHVAKDPEEARSLALAWWLSQSQKFIEQQGQVSWALSGGKTPKALYEALAEQQALAWRHIYAYQVDERDKEFSSEESNFGMILRAGLGKRLEHFFPMRQQPFEKRFVSVYEQQLHKHCANGAIDLVLLGMGSDGHTASLFPDTPESLHATSSLVILHQVPSLANTWRQTLSLECLLRARHVLFYCLGSDKHEKLQRVWSDPNCLLPAALVCQGRLARGLPTHWIVDRAAEKGPL